MLLQMCWFLGHSVQFASVSSFISTNVTVWLEHKQIMLGCNAIQFHQGKKSCLPTMGCNHFIWKPNFEGLTLKSCVKGLVIINTWDWGRRKYNFFSKKLITHPNFPSNFHTSSENLQKHSYPKVCKFFMYFRIFKNPIKNRFKDKHLTATYNLIALNIRESAHINYVQYWRE